MNQKENKILPRIAAALVAAGLIFYGGFQYGQKTQPPAVTDTNEFLNADFSLFWDAVKVIKNRYVGIKNVKDQDILYGAIKGITGSLDDPYSSFFNPGDAKKFEQDIQGSFGGIGAEIGMRDNQLSIVAPLKNSPSEKIGLKASDKILKINDTYTLDLTVDEAVKLIRGEPDTAVTLLIFRDGWKEAKEFKIIRKVITIPTLDWEMKPGNIAYIHLYNFNANAPTLFYQATLGALLQGAKGVILDLRNNPGGFLEVSVNLGGWFFKRGDVVLIERFKSGNEREHRADGNAALLKVPTVLLVNGGSASASEILAGALRDNRGIVLIGEKTFGKGTVQEIESLKDGSTLKISIAEWLTPKGHEINKKGLAPDIEVKISDDDIEKKRDPQLDKAMETIKAIIQK
ncbi:S41 family peptidase [Candidatus Jorgensenbacteria bacterium]|nr:S41 family peptidase [Candidatus Jorgensenbacteria bacterium]